MIDITLTSFSALPVMFALALEGKRSERVTIASSCFQSPQMVARNSHSISFVDPKESILRLAMTTGSAFHSYRRFDEQHHENRRGQRNNTTKQKWMISRSRNQ